MFIGKGWQWRFNDWAAERGYRKRWWRTALCFYRAWCLRWTVADITAQTADVLRQIDDWLAQCGSDKAHIVEATIFLANMADYAGMNAAWDAWVDANHSPARACVEAKLVRGEWLVEIKVSAVVKTA